MFGKLCEQYERCLSVNTSKAIQGRLEWLKLLKTLLRALGTLQKSSPLGGLLASLTEMLGRGLTYAHTNRSVIHRQTYMHRHTEKVVHGQTYTPN